MLLDVGALSAQALAVLATAICMESHIPSSRVDRCGKLLQAFVLHPKVLGYAADLCVSNVLQLYASSGRIDACVHGLYLKGKVHRDVYFA